MSDANRVLWSEGLFLRTQHFQQQDRYTEAVVRGALAGRAAADLRLPLPDARPRAAGVGRSRRPVGARHLSRTARPSPSPRPWTRPSRWRSAATPVPARCSSRCRWNRRAAPASIPRTRDAIRRALPRRIVPVRDAVQGGAEPEEIEIARPQPCCSPRANRSAATPALPVAELRGLRADGSVALASGFLPPALATGAVACYAQLVAGGDHRPRPHRRGAWPDGARRRRAQRREPA